MRVRDQLQKNGLTDDEILRLFRESQRQLILVIERANPESPFRRYRIEQLRAIERIIRRLDKKAKAWAEKEIPKLVRAGEADAVEAVKAFGEKEFNLSFSGVPQDAVKVLTETSLMDFGNTIAAFRRNGTRAVLDKKKLHDHIVEGIVQGSSVARTEKQLVQSIKEQGIEVLKAKNGFGRRFSLEHYTNMLVRSQSMAAYNIGTKNQLLGMGRRFAKIPKIVPDIDGDDICNRFEEQVYIDSKDPAQLPPYHPNCRHVPIPVSFAELKANRPDLYRTAVGYFRSRQS